MIVYRRWREIPSAVWLIKWRCHQKISSFFLPPLSKIHPERRFISGPFSERWGADRSEMVVKGKGKTRSFATRYKPLQKLLSETSADFSGSVSASRVQRFRFALSEKGLVQLRVLPNWAPLGSFSVNDKTHSHTPNPSFPFFSHRLYECFGESWVVINK